MPEAVGQTRMRSERPVQGRQPLEYSTITAIYHAALGHCPSHWALPPYRIQNESGIHCWRRR